MARLTDLFTVKVSAAHFHAAAAGEEEADDLVTAAMIQFSDFHNISSPVDATYSRCEPDPRVTRADAVKEGQRLLSIMLFSKAVPQ